MSWFAVHYVLRKSSHPAVKGVPKFLLLVIAHFVRKNYTITPALSVGDLKEMLGVDESTIRRNRDLLCSPEVGELARHRRGKRDLFQMLKLSGPLFVDQRFDYAGKSPGSTSGIRANRPDLGSGLDDSMCANRPDLASMCANRPDLSRVRTKELEEEDLRTSTSSSDHCARPSEFVSVLETVQRFVDWWTEAYPMNNAGALSSVRDCDRNAAQKLLKSGRTVTRAQAMSLLLWGAERDGHRDPNWSWIGPTDRSISVLWHKADFLEREVLRLGLDAPPEDPSEQLRREIVSRWLAYCHQGHSAAQWLVPFRFVSDVEGILTVWAPTFEDLDRLTRFGFEKPLAQAVNDILGPRRIEFTWGAGSEEEATG